MGALEKDSSLTEGLRELGIGRSFLDSVNSAASREDAEMALRGLQEASRAALRRVALELHPDRCSLLGEEERADRERRMKLAAAADTAVQRWKLKPLEQLGSAVQFVVKSRGGLNFKNVYTCVSANIPFMSIRIRVI